MASISTAATVVEDLLGFVEDEAVADLVRVEIGRCFPCVFERVLMPRLRATPRSVLLLGPRQVGKSTLLGSLEPDRILNRADPGVHRCHAARPELLLQALEAAPDSNRVVFIDEVQ